MQSEKGTKILTYRFILPALVCFGTNCTLNQFFLEVKMHKFLKACHNRHIHEKWSKSEDSMQVINLRTKYGLSELANIFQTFLKEEVGVQALIVTNVCLGRLEQCLLKG